MRAVQQTVEPFAVPAQAEVSPGTKSLRHALDIADGHPFELAALDAGNLSSADAGGRREVHLAPPSSHSKRPNAAPESNEIHPLILACGAYARIVAWDLRAGGET